MTKVDAGTGQTEILSRYLDKDDFLDRYIRRDGSDEFSAVNEKDLDSPRFEGLKRVYYTEPDPAGAERVFFLKLEKGEFADMARPFYIKKSSAENMK